MATVLLAIEASQRTGGVAVRDEHGEAHVEWMTSTVRFDDDLLPAIDRLYRRLGLAPDRTRAVGVSVGPGGFTGLRISVSTAKMLAETLAAQIIAVPSALVAAEAHEGPGPIIVALASKGETTWVTRLDRSDEHDGAWASKGDGHLVDAAGICLDGIRTMLADRYLPQPVRERCATSGSVHLGTPSQTLAALDQFATDMPVAGAMYVTFAPVERR
ncbi:MAG: tRNA (adenosine(37)-N6)-threonylcarbamoyltransferase complex dimerization subunit type 1 TsaB [Planctomycetota bacterium]|jgi:tRNA threonylcarbamoyl adenosine modification protein YeaZ